MSKTRVVILFGGVSSEHSISCATASGVLSAIDREKYEVIPVGITQTGVYVPAEDSVSKWALTEGELPVVEFDSGKCPACTGRKHMVVLANFLRLHHS